MNFKAIKKRDWNVLDLQEVSVKWAVDPLHVPMYSFKKGDKSQLFKKRNVLTNLSQNP